MRTRFLVCLLLFSHTAGATCFRLAAEEFQLDWRIIYAVATVESNLKVDAINVNKNKSMDIGIMQINTIHLKELAQQGISLNELFEPCKNVIVGAWLLKRKIMSAGGNVWKGVGYYHSATPEYQRIYINKVKKVYNRLDRIAFNTE